MKEKGNQSKRDAELDRVKGDLKNVQSQINDLVMQESDARSRLSKVEALVEGAVLAAIRPLVTAFTSEIKHDRQSIAAGLRQLLDRAED